MSTGPVFVNFTDKLDRFGEIMSDDISAFAPGDAGRRLNGRSKTRFQVAKDRRASAPSTARWTTGAHEPTEHAANQFSSDLASDGA